MNWQPIDTAPKDGTPVLVSDGEGVAIAAYRKRRRPFGLGTEMAWCETTEDGVEWFNGWCELSREPIYWAKLEPPA